MISIQSNAACFGKGQQTWKENIFWPVEWFDGHQVDAQVVGLLPRKARAMTPKEVAMCQKWFGPDGQYPLVHIETGELRDV